MADSNKEIHYTMIDQNEKTMCEINTRVRNAFLGISDPRIIHRVLKITLSQLYVDGLTEEMPIIKSGVN